MQHLRITSARENTAGMKLKQLQLNHRLVTYARSRWIQGLVLYGFSFAILSFIIFSTPAFLGTDDYYHARLADQIVEQRRLRLDFPWLPLTVLNNADFTDHHLLFHLYVAPWAHWGGIDGTKLAAVSIAAGIVVAVWLVLRSIDVTQPMMWALLLLGLSTPFLYRMLMVRTQGASLLILILAVNVMFRRRYLWLLPIGFGYAWLYNGFVLLIGVAGMYILSAWIIERRFEWKPLAYSTTGILCGLILNPYFPENFAFILQHLGEKVDIENGIRVGNEWYAYRTDTLLTNSRGALALFALGILRSGVGKHKRDVAEMTLLLVALLTLYMVFQSRRFIEYFPAFALLFAAASWGRGDISWQELLPAFMTRYQRSVQAVLIMALLAAGSFFVVSTIRATRADAQNVRPVDAYAGATDWLKTYTPSDALVFQTDWDDFTRLFYYDTHNTYLVGLDPTYFQRENPELWDQWLSITHGDVANPSEAIHNLFGADYVFSDRKHLSFAAQADDDPNLRLVYRDEYSLVWRIISVDDPE